jgi:Ca2+/Na+ antiporter
MKSTDKDLFECISTIVTKINSSNGISILAILYVMSYLMHTRPIIVSFLVICAYLCIGYICGYIYTKFYLENKNGENATDVAATTATATAATTAATASAAAIPFERQPTDLFDDDVDKEKEEERKEEKDNRVTVAT